MPPVTPADGLSAASTMPWALRDYAFLGDGERGAVVGPRGEVVWLCAPRWDGDAVFSALLGGPGEYLVRPEDDWHVWGGYYEDGTLIRVSRWVSADAVIECRDAFASPAAPGRLVLLRRIRAVRGEARVRVRLDPRPGFGGHAVDWRREGGLWCASGGGLDVRWAGAAEARPAPGGGLRTSLALREGGAHDLVLEVSGDGGPPGVLEAAPLWEATERWWRAAVPRCADLPADADARHAYAVLNGLTSAGGGMVAAATTALPERADTGRNYDYRYAWLRDQAYAGIAVAVHGPHPLLDRAVRFAAARVLEDGGRLRPAYTVSGGRVPPERSLSLPGYPGGGDRVGNHAGEQFQLDTFGEVLQLFAAAAAHDRLDGDARRAVDVVVEAVEASWLEPDAGVWELERRWWAHSRLAVLCGLRSLAGVLPGRDARRWLELADGVERETRRRCLRKDGAWARAEDDQGPDASMLAPLGRGGLPDGDPSVARTRRLIARELTRDGFVYRFHHEGNPLGEAEGAFLLCGFTMAMATVREGDALGAYRWFERTRSAYGPAGLFAEEYDVGQRQLRGNLPQAFVHAALLESVARLASA
ncbi:MULTISPECIES: glycoside hydrolase family 15 protein [Actinomadura]|uniref:Glycoside hydrolase family 15 protein n=1 Tax=Actinomadura yumaensis TaxID=111807 RepID=A0ABW2D141_9ACTN|nr:glycoside hydrolase family 15 protein [Actinomadura sp. J1-007]MWK39353.1 glycoside hydrolase family 15 protein [Actinomadura sp. J1-007]